MVLYETVEDCAFQSWCWVFLKCFKLSGPSNLKLDSALNFVHQPGRCLQLCEFFGAEFLLYNTGYSVAAQYARQRQEDFLLDSMDSLDQCWDCLDRVRVSEDSWSEISAAQSDRPRGISLQLDYFISGVDDLFVTFNPILFVTIKTSWRVDLAQSDAGNVHATPNRNRWVPMLSDNPAVPARIRI